MNQLKNEFNRGFSLKNDDIRFVDAAIRNAIADICKGLGGDAYILHGCEITILDANTLNITEGAIFYANEIWHVAAHTTARPVNWLPLWCFRKLYDPAGAKLDADLVSHNTYELRDAICSAVNNDPGVFATISSGDVPRLKDVLFEVTEGNVSLLNGSEVIDPVLVKCFKKIATIGGTISATLGSATAFTVLNVPAGFRPSSAVRGYLPVKTVFANTERMARFTLGTNGDLSVILIGGSYVDEACSIPLSIPSYLTT